MRLAEAEYTTTGKQQELTQTRSDEADGWLRSANGILRLRSKTTPRKRRKCLLVTASNAQCKTISREARI